MARDIEWFDEAAGPLVRPYTVTRGRTRSGREELPLITLIVALHPATEGLVSRLGPEHSRILALCQTPMSVAEVAAHLQLPLSVIKILIGDLIDDQLVTFRTAGAPSVEVLQAVINGIRWL